MKVALMVGGVLVAVLCVYAFVSSVVSTEHAQDVGIQQIQSMVVGGAK